MLGNGRYVKASVCTSMSYAMLEFELCRSSRCWAGELFGGAEFTAAFLRRAAYTENYVVSMPRNAAQKPSQIAVRKNVS